MSTHARVYLCALAYGVVLLKRMSVDTPESTDTPDMGARDPCTDAPLVHIGETTHLYFPPQHALAQALFYEIHHYHYRKHHVFPPRHHRHHCSRRRIHPHNVFTVVVIFAATSRRFHSGVVGQQSRNTSPFLSYPSIQFNSKATAQLRHIVHTWSVILSHIVSSDSRHPPLLREGAPEESSSTRLSVQAST